MSELNCTTHGYREPRLAQFSLLTLRAMEPMTVITNAYCTLDVEVRQKTMRPFSNGV